MGTRAPTLSSSTARVSRPSSSVTGLSSNSSLTGSRKAMSGRIAPFLFVRCSTHRSICDPSPPTLPLSPVRWGPSTLGGESRPANQPGEAGGRAASHPAVRLDQGQDPLLLCCQAKAHLRPPPNSTSCLQLNVSSGERWLEAAAGQLQVEPGGVRAYRGDPVELRGWRGSESESVLKE